MFGTPAISRPQIALEIAPGLHLRRFEVAILARQKLHRVATTKIACVKGPLEFTLTKNKYICKDF